MNNPHSLELGRTYLTVTGITVTPVKLLPNQKAIFVSDEFYPTPFVTWSYGFTSEGTLTLYSGNYYQTLDQALTDESDSPEPMQLEMSFYCPDCEKLHHHEFPCYGSVQDLVEQIEDTRVHCPDCGYTFMGIHAITIYDDCTQYDLPLWHGPVQDDAWE